MNISPTAAVQRVISPIEFSISSVDPRDYQSVTERYYSKLYSLDQDRDRHHDILVLNHSNKICLITLAPSHPVIANNLKVTKVNFEVSKKLDRKSNKTSGKSKKGGQLLDPASLLAIIQTEDGTEFAVRAVVPGKLIGVNAALTREPGLLTAAPQAEGHIAIILPAKGAYEATKASLVVADDYTYSQ